MNPHGGPWARDTWGYNPEVQFLAARGYAVLQMNFRGSTGYGRKFTELGYKQWGQTMQNDITDGVEWLIKQGIADPKRIAIYGASYGGYATLAGVTFTPDLYACAIDYVGVANLFTFMQTIPPYWKPLLDMMYEMVGDPVKDKEMMEKYSPVFHVDQIKAPLFVAQGANDPRVNKAESDQMVEALKKRGIEVEYMVKEQRRNMASTTKRINLISNRAMDKFLSIHLKEIIIIKQIKNGRTIKLILYYFAYQFAVAIPGMFGYTIWKCFETQSFDLHNAPTSLAIILSLLGTLLMAWHLIHYKYVKLDKQTLASLPLKPTCLYILMGAAAIIWMNWLSEMVHLPNIAEKTSLHK